jgi:hypothetical protein
MKATRVTRALVVLGLVAGPLCADTLVLRNGRRVEGELVGFRSGRIEFEDSRGRVERYDREEVARIEFEQDRWSGGGDQGGGRPSGLRERSFSVAAAETWTDTGIEVRRGQRLWFDASGRVTWGRDRRDGPGGEGGNHYNANRPIPSRPGGALIGRIGRDPFFIGSDQGPIEVRGSGRLYLGVNDDFLQDNSGSFRVVVYY